MKLGSSSFKRQRLLSSCRGSRTNRFSNSNSNARPPKLLVLSLLLALWNILYLCPCCDSLSPRPTTIARMASSIPTAESIAETDSAGQQEQPEAPLFSVGMIADIQYAPIPDGASYSGTPRYYRHSLEATKYAFEAFRDYPTCKDLGKDDASGVDFVINLGDIVDGKCQDIERNGGCLPSPEGLLGQSDEENARWKDLVDHPGMLSLLEIQHAMKPYLEEGGQKDTTNRKVLHSYGNHCLYNLNRTELKERLGIPFRAEAPIRGFGSFSKQRKEESMQGNENGESGDGDLVGYYSYVYPPSGSLETNQKTNRHRHSIKFIVLDSYDIALMRRGNNSRKRSRAVEILQEQNGKNFGEGNENSPEGLEGLQKRFVAFNGAVGETQLEWLREELEATRQHNNHSHDNQNDCDTPLCLDQKVILLSHQPIHPGSSNPVCLIWNYDAVLDILREYSDVVVASFAGHAHKGGYALDEASGIHFRVVEAVLESKPPTKTFGILDVYSDRLELKGYGDCQSAVYRFDGGNGEKPLTDDGSHSETKTKSNQEESELCA